MFPNRPRGTETTVFEPVTLDFGAHHSTQNPSRTALWEPTTCQGLVRMASVRVGFSTGQKSALPQDGSFPSFQMFDAGPCRRNRRIPLIVVPVGARVASRNEVRFGMWNGSKEVSRYFARPISAGGPLYLGEAIGPCAGDRLDRRLGQGSHFGHGADPGCGILSGFDSETGSCPMWGVLRGANVSGLCEARGSGTQSCGMRASEWPSRQTRFPFEQK
jgi:hypothetical protein